MRAVIVRKPGGVENLEIADVPVPEVRPGEILVEVAAAGVNRADLLQRRGFYPPPPGASDVLGLEVSGTVAAHGPGVTAPAVGTPVTALLSGGGYAEYVSVPVGQIAPVPAGIDLVSAAALPEVACTVWSNVVMTAKLSAGETLLVHGGASGIGTMAIQIATALGARVATTVGSPEKAAAVGELGADVVVNYRDGDFADALKAAGIRADVILDIMGAKYLASNVRTLATGGRLVVIGMQGGVTGELDLGALLARRASITATSLRARPSEEKAAIVAETVAHVWPLVEAGSVRPIVHTVLPLDEVRRAHEVLEESSHIGKVLLTVG